MVKSAVEKKKQLEVLRHDWRAWGGSFLQVSRAAPREHDNELKSIKGQGAGYRGLQEWSLLRGGESLCKRPGAVAGRCVWETSRRPVRQEQKRWSRNREGGGRGGSGGRTRGPSRPRSGMWFHLLSHWLVPALSLEESLSLGDTH